MLEITCLYCHGSQQISPDRRGTIVACEHCGADVAVPRAEGRANSAAATLDNHPAETDAYSDGPPVDAVTETRMRGRFLLLLGVLLIVGFLLPSCEAGKGGSRLMFLSIEGVFEKRVPIAAKLLLLFPLVAGAFVLAARFLVRPPLRGWLILATGCVPFLLLIPLISPKELRQVVASGPGGSMFDVVMLFIAMIAFLALCAATRIRFYRPGLHVAYLIGLVGAVVTLLSQVIPQGGRIPVHRLIERLSNRTVGSLSGLLATGGLIAASILCIRNKPTRAPAAAASHAKLAFLILLCAIVLSGMSEVFRPPPPDKWGRVPAIDGAMLSFRFKVLLTYGLVLAMLPIGLADAIVGRSTHDNR